MSANDEGMTWRYLAVSRGTLACLQNSVTRTGDRRKICFYLALMSISCDVSSPRLILLLDMILSKKDSLGRRKIDSFWDGMMVLPMKPN